jgi:hypothetical protein
MMAAAPAEEPEGNGPARLSHFERKGLALALVQAQAIGAARLGPSFECTGLRNNAQDADDGRIETRLDCARSRCLKNGVKGLDGGGL